MKKHGFYTKCVEVEEYQKVVKKLSAAREALSMAGEDIHNEFCGTREHDSCVRVKEALKVIGEEL